MSLSVHRTHKRFKPPSSAEPTPSLLSQSFFLDKMTKSVAAIVEAMRKQLSDMQIKDNLLLEHDQGTNEDIAGCNNSISTQTPFAFSQLNDEGDGHNAPNMMVSSPPVTVLDTR